MSRSFSRLPSTPVLRDVADTQQWLRLFLPSLAREMDELALLPADRVSIVQTKSLLPDPIPAGEGLVRFVVDEAVLYVQRPVPGSSPQANEWVPASPQALYAVLSASTTPSSPNLTTSFVDVDWLDTIDAQKGLSINTGTSVVTPTVTGLYQVNAFLDADFTAPGTRTKLKLRLGDVATGLRAGPISGSTGVPATDTDAAVSLSTTVVLTAGEEYVLQTRSTATSITITTWNEASLSVHYIDSP